MFWQSVAASYLSDTGRRYVLASLIRKSGSSYFQPGARMIIRDDGQFYGSISAGCLEESIADAAVECLNKQQNRILEIDTRPFFGCFGKISVLLEVLPAEDTTALFFQQIQASLENRTPFTVCTDYTDIGRDVLTFIGTAEPNEQVLIEQVDPKPRVLVFGDWPDGQTVVRIAQIMDWDVLNYDVSGPGFSAEQILSNIVPDNMTAAIVMGHNFARDILCLKQLLKMPLGYIGMIGSRKRREEVINELIDGTDEQLIQSVERLHCPAGLDLGGDGHEAIALSVAAEIHANLYQHKAVPLKDKKLPVHSREPIQ